MEIIIHLKQLILYQIKESIMGSTGIITKKSFSEILLQEYNTADYTVIDHAMIREQPLNGEMERAVAYCAIKHPDGYVFGMVVKFERIQVGYSKEEVIFKAITEQEGPVFYDCPQHIGKLLSPLSELSYEGYAKSWREKNMIL